MPSGSLVTTKVDANGDKVTITRTLAAEIGVTTTNVIAGGVWTKTYYEYDSDLVGWKIVEVRNSQNALPFFSVEIPDRTRIFPIEFRPLLKTTTTKEVFIGNASMPALTTGQLLWSEQQRDAFTYERVQESLDTLPGATSISRKETRPDGQVATIVDTLQPSGTSTAVPTALKEVAVRDLGIGFEIETITTVPEVFVAGSYTKTVIDLIPPELKAAVPIVELDETLTGLASTNPILLTGELSRNEQQVTEFTKRVRTKSTGSIALPVSITALETNRDKQTVSVIYTLEVAGTNAAVPTALVDVEVKALGNGLEVVTKRTIAAVFPATTYSISMLNLIPAEFRGSVPTKTSDVTSDGIASTNPMLLAGELERSETQVTAFTRRVRTTGFGTVTLPITFTGGEKLVEKFGVQLLAKKVISLAALGTTVLPFGPLVIEAEKTQISAFMEITTSLVSAAPTWPVIHSLLYDEEMKVLFPEDRQIVDPNLPITIPSPTATDLVELKGLDQYHAWKITTSKFPTANSRANANVSDIMKPFTFPGRFNVNLARVYGGVVASKRPTSSLVRITQYQWWVISPIKPVLTFDEIKTQTAYWWDQASQPRPDAYENVICDSYSISLYGSVLVVPASSPSLSEFAGSGGFAPAYVTWTQNSSSVVGTNTDFSIYSQILQNNPFALLDAPDGSSWGFSVYSKTIMVLKAGGFNADQTPSFPPYKGPTTKVPTISSVPLPAGTAPTGWVGSSRVIAATVEPDKLPNLWRITTHEVVMR
jgi:hypothetical protein